MTQELPPPSEETIREILRPTTPSLLDLSFLNRGGDQRTPSFQGRTPLPLRRIRNPVVPGMPPLPADADQRAYMLGECTVLLTRDWGAMFHLSIAHHLRYPTWDEIAEARYRLLPDGITMVLALPPYGEYINIHKNCFQLHQIPNADNIPTPEELAILRREGDAALRSWEGGPK